MPGADKGLRLAKALNVSMEWLFDDAYGICDDPPRYGVALEVDPEFWKQWRDFLAAKNAGREAALVPASIRLAASQFEETNKPRPGKQRRTQKKK